jgi:hypothetical protein
MSLFTVRSFALQCSIAVAACGGSSGTVCTLDTDCPSHFCKADGTCGPVEIDAAVGSDAPIDGTSSLCTPDHDGHITLAELPLVAGQMATFRIATNATIDTAGTSNPDGSRTWDLSAQLSGDADVSVALAAPAGSWWAGDFTSATYDTPLTSTSNLIGVFSVSATAVSLPGVVSPDSGATATELTYSPPAKILALPITAGATWTSTSTISGTAQGVIASYSEKYTSRVDQVGTMKTPYGTFPVLRVATDLDRTSLGVTILTTRTFAWVAECFGPIATITSQNNETGSEFTSAAEVRRLAP